MILKKCRFGGFVALCVLVALFPGHVSAQNPAPASTSSSPAPVVSFNTLPALQVSTPIPGSTHVPGDFNGDGTSDVLWFNPTQSQLSYWTMTAVTPTSPIGGGVTHAGTSRTFNITPGYFVGAVGDFNNDGFADLVFTSVNHDLWLWTNNQNGGFTSTEITTYPAQWQLIGAGDVDGDGYDDLLWIDATDCEFAYWTMHGATRTGYRIIPITCGYRPVAVGYFTPTNRISILWTSAANDLYVWDSTGAGFKSYDLTSYLDVTYVGNAEQLPFGHMFALGGGYMGSGIGIEMYAPDNNGVYGQAAEGAQLSRNFDDQGNQTGVTAFLTWVGGIFGPYVSAGYLIQGNNTNATAFYSIYLPSATLANGGLPNGNPSFTGSAPGLNDGNSWAIPTGMSVVGSPANVMTTPPWQ